MLNIRFPKSLTAFLFILIAFSSCNDVKVVKTKDFSIDVPEDFTKTNGINQYAVLQYQNTNEGLFFIVLEEPKANFKNAIDLAMYKTTADLSGYFNVVSKHFAEITKNFTVTDVKHTKINSSDAIIFSMSGESIEFKKNVFYRYALIDDGKNFYQIMCWTSPKNKQKLLDKTEGMLSSFKANSKQK